MFDAYLGAMRRYANFQGRMARGDYWRFVLVFVGLAVIAVVLDQTLRTANRDGGLFIGLVYVVHFLPLLGAGVRRMHDSDHSGWWVLLSPVALVFACMPGTTGPNRFGAATSPTAEDRAVAATSALASPTPSAMTPRDPIAELERLAQLRANGSLSAAEFEVMKARALAESRNA